MRWSSHDQQLRLLGTVACPVWIRIILALWRDKQDYQRETFEAAQRAHGRRVA
jgi:hypothetical protein